MELGLLGILLGLGLLMWLAYRGWSVILVAPVAALVAAGISGEPLLAHWTETFMRGTSRFVFQWFPMFLLGGLFGKLMEDSRSISAVARSLTERLGTARTMLAVVLASAVVTYGGVSVFVAFFVLVPMAEDMFRNANLPRRLMPAAIGLGAFTFTMSVMPGTPSINNAIPMPYFGTTAFAAPGIGLISSAIIVILGMWWLLRAEAAARRAGEGYKPRADRPGTADATPEIDEKARGYAKGRFVLRLESPQGTIQYGLRREVLEGEIEEPDVLLRHLDAVTVEDVQRVARDLFEAKRLYLALVGPFDDPARFVKLLAA